MFVVTVIVSVVLALAALGSAAAKLTENPKIVTTLGGLGVPMAWLPKLAAAEIAGAVGLLIGLAVPAIGIAAAAGLVGYFVGAVITHLKANDHEIVPPAVLGLVAVAAMALRIATM